MNVHLILKILLLIDNRKKLKFNNNETITYRSWQYFKRLDAFVHIIPDDYWVYKKLDLIIQYIFQIYLIWKVKIYLLHL